MELLEVLDAVTVWFDRDGTAHTNGGCRPGSGSQRPQRRYQLAAGSLCPVCASWLLSYPGTASDRMAELRRYEAQLATVMTDFLGGVLMNRAARAELDRLESAVRAVATQLETGMTLKADLLLRVGQAKARIIGFSPAALAGCV